MKHRLLIIGAGSIGERHLRCFQATERVELGLCEARQTLCEEIVLRYGLSAAWTSAEKALGEEWDAVLIATPAHTHLPLALQAAEAGCHLLIEKPLSTSLEGVAALTEKVAAGSLHAAVSYNYRAHPGIRALKAAVDSGDFGAPLQCYAVLGQRFAQYRPAYADIYFADRAQGGGAVQDALTHVLNLVEWILGPVDEIVVDARHQALAGVTVEDTVHAMARHGSVMASYALNLYQQPNESAITVVCEGGTLRFELHKSRLRWMTSPDGAWNEEKHVLPDRDSWYELNAHAFLDGLEGRTPLLCPLDAGVQTLRVNLAALQSMETRQWVAIEGGARGYGT